MATTTVLAVINTALPLGLIQFPGYKVRRQPVARQLHCNQWPKPGFGSFRFTLLWQFDGKTDSSF
jgi:hypothetical protein